MTACTAYLAESAWYVRTEPSRQLRQTLLAARFRPRRVGESLRFVLTDEDALLRATLSNRCGREPRSFSPFPSGLHVFYIVILRIRSLLHRPSSGLPINFNRVAGLISTRYILYLGPPLVFFEKFEYA